MCGYNHGHDGKIHLVTFSFALSFNILCLCATAGFSAGGTEGQTCTDCQTEGHKQCSHSSSVCLTALSMMFVQGALLPWAGGKLDALPQFSCPAPKAPSGANRVKLLLPPCFGTNLLCTPCAAEVPEPHHRAHRKKSSWAGRDPGHSCAF